MEKNGKKREKKREKNDGNDMVGIMNHLAFAIIIGYRSCLPENVLIINQNIKFIINYFIVVEL